MYVYLHIYIYIQVCTYYHISCIQTYRTAAGASGDPPHRAAAGAPGRRLGRPSAGEVNAGHWETSPRNGGFMRF